MSKIERTLTKTERNLWNAIVTEAMAQLKYSAFAHKALEEGHPEVAQVFQEVAGAENIHGMNHLRVFGRREVERREPQGCRPGGIQRGQRRLSQDGKGCPGRRGVWTRPTPSRWLWTGRGITWRSSPWPWRSWRPSLPSGRRLQMVRQRLLRRVPSNPRDSAAQSPRYPPPTPPPARR